MYHFGEGLVRTPDDLGIQSGKPTHPELLDFLSSWFMDDYGEAKPAWSVKALHKAIMLSSAYQQSEPEHSHGSTKGYGCRECAVVASQCTAFRLRGVPGFSAGYVRTHGHHDVWISGESA